MAFTYTNSRGQVYALHRRETTLKTGQVRVLHFFSRTAGHDAIDAIPAGYAIVESQRTGLPLLKRA